MALHQRIDSPQETVSGTVGFDHKGLCVVQLRAIWPACSCREWPLASPRALSWLSLILSLCPDIILLTGCHLFSMPLEGATKDYHYYSVSEIWACIIGTETLNHTWFLPDDPRVLRITLGNQRHTFHALGTYSDILLPLGVPCSQEVTRVTTNRFILLGQCFFHSDRPYMKLNNFIWCQIASPFSWSSNWFWQLIFKLYFYNCTNCFTF